MQKLANKSIWVVEKDNPVKKTKRSTKSSKQSAILEQLEVDLGLATKKPRVKSTKKSELPVVKIHFLGGVEEIGKNCTAIECMDDIIVIDVGMSFPDGEMPGIDAVVPDTTFLEDNKDRLRAVILTHGHEDHVGGLPHLLAKVKVPVFGCKLALMILENKLVERKIEADLHTIRAGNEITLGCFKVEFIHVNHSIEGSTALCITTPLGKIFHTGDFKIDYTPVDNHITDLKRISQIGNEGVLCLLAESTNVEKAGYSISE
ncbi:MAG: ribonuclease J, partial [Clostridia bacterium]|nr:ribonuclease J [Clostridia bacterium]